MGTAKLILHDLYIIYAYIEFLQRCTFLRLMLISFQMSTAFSTYGFTVIDTNLLPRQSLLLVLLCKAVGDFMCIILSYVHNKNPIIHNLIPFVIPNKHGTSI